MNRRVAVLLALALTLPLAGCEIIEYPSRIPDSGQSHVHLYGNISETGNTTTITGEINLYGYTWERAYDNVTLHIYGENDTLLRSVALGSFDAMADPPLRSHSVNLSITGPQPRAVVIGSQDFWTQNTTVAYYCYNATQNTWTESIATTANETKRGCRG